MNLLVVQPRLSYFVGGGEVVAAVHCMELQQRGNYVTLLTSTYGYSFLLEQVIASGVFVIRLPIPESVYSIKAGEVQSRWTKESFAFIRRAIPTMSEISFDILITHHSLDGLLATFTSRPSVLHLHGIPPAIGYGVRLAARANVMLIAHAAAIGTFWRSSVREVGHKIQVVNNGVTLSEHIKAENQECTHVIDILFLGRLITNKGVHVLLDAVELLHWRGISVKVTIAGAGPILASLQDKAARWDRQGNVRFLGFVDHETKTLLLREAKIFVSPSLAREAVMLTMLEAAAASKPIVTTTAGGTTEFAINEWNALVVPPNDAFALASAIERLLPDQRLRKRLGTQARQDVEKWSWDIQVNRLQLLYESIL